VISKISSHNVFLYNPETNKYIKKSIHINRIKPCYQREDDPEEDEDIGDIPIVEVTYSETFPKTPHPMAQPEIEIPIEQNTHLKHPPENDNAPIDKPPTMDSHIVEQASPVTEPSSIEPSSNEAQHGSSTSANLDEMRQTR